MDYIKGPCFHTHPPVSMKRNQTFTTPIPPFLSKRKEKSNLISMRIMLNFKKKLWAPIKYLRRELYPYKRRLKKIILVCWFSKHLGLTGLSSTLILLKMHIENKNSNYILEVYRHQFWTLLFKNAIYSMSQIGKVWNLIYLFNLWKRIIIKYQWQNYNSLQGRYAIIGMIFWELMSRIDRSELLPIWII